MANGHTIEQIAAALVEYNGNISAAARSLGVTRAAVWKRIQDSTTLKQVLHDARQTRIDTAESSLDRAVLDGEGWAVSLILKTLGKDRGYVERTEHELIGGYVLEVEAVEADGSTSQEADPHTVVEGTTDVPQE